MAKLYFRYGAMGSSKTANAVMVQYNYRERGREVLMLKPKLENRDGASTVKSRCGLETECRFVEDLTLEAARGYDCIIVDEAQFLTREEVEFLAHLVDDFDIPVLCYGLRADFRGELFPGSYALLVMADELEEMKTVCWCGKRASFNARFDENGKVVKEGEQVLLGANDKYIALCRKHWMHGDLGPDWGK